MFSFMKFYDDDIYSRADRIWHNDDGSKSYGFDNDDGTTDWYDSNGYLDTVTDTPDDDEQLMNDYSSWLYD